MFEWLESNTRTIGILLTVIGILVTSLIGYIKLLVGHGILKEDVNDMKNTLDAHIRDEDKHVNQLYIGTLRDAIQELKEDSKRSRAALSDKIDNLTRLMYRSQNNAKSGNEGEK